ncbi:DNRLRE domain-containing protein [Brevibacillus fortis]|uniref:DNRLRE domain-containing protein n=1 Tax=Brevibacillus fortis TaxID=2126352 RepID=UPI0038FD0BED
MAQTIISGFDDIWVSPSNYNTNKYSANESSYRVVQFVIKRVSDGKLFFGYKVESLEANTFSVGIYDKAGGVYPSIEAKNKSGIVIGDATGHDRTLSKWSNNDTGNNAILVYALDNYNGIEKVRYYGKDSAWGNDLEANNIFVDISFTNGGNFAGSFEITGTVISSYLNIAPTLSLTSPANNQTIKQGTDINFQWSGSDPDGDALTYTLQVGTSAGASNIYNASVGSATSKKEISTSWAVGLYYWRVVANDGKGGVTTSVEGTFGIALGNLVTLDKSNTVITDTFVSQSSPAASFGTIQSIQWGNGSSGANDQIRALLKFDLGPIPNNAIINSATLKLYNYSNSVTRQTNVHLVTSVWDNFATWNTQPSYDPSIKSSFSNYPTGQYVSIDIKTLVQDWVNGTQNLGLLLKDFDESGAGTVRIAYSSEGTYKPQLTIDYSIPATSKKQVEYVGSNGSQMSNSSSLPTGLPSGWKQGDLLIAHVLSSDSGTLNTPAGWTLLNTDTNALRQSLYYKFAGASETAPTFTCSTAVNWVSYISAFRNVKAIDVTNVGKSSSATSVSPPSTSTTKANTLFVLFNSIMGNNTQDQPLGYNEMYDYTPASGAFNIEASMHYMHLDLDQTSAEMQTRTTTTSSGIFISRVVALEPITNNPPTLTLTSPANNQTLAEGSTYKLEGTVSDVEAGSALVVKYSIAGGTTQSIPVGTSDGKNPKSFSKTLTYSQGRFWDGQTDVSGLLLAEVSSIQVWAYDGTDGSTKQMRNFTVVQESGKLYVPVNVVSSAYLVSKMAPPVRVSNGWIIGAVMTGSNTSLYVSKDNGKFWSLLRTTSYNLSSISLAAKGNNVFIIGAFNNTNIHMYRVDVTTSNGEAIPPFSVSLDSGQTALGGVTTAITLDGTKLWWAASTKNSAYPNSFNIRTGSIPINADGTLGTPSAGEQITNINDILFPSFAQSPSLVTDGNGTPCIIFENVGAFVSSNNQVGYTQGNAITFIKKDKTLSSSICLKSDWSYRPIELNSSYAQTSPMAIRTPNGKLHVVWHARDAANTTDNYVRYSYSMDGVTWSTPKKIGAGQTASITSNKNGKLFLTYENGGYINRLESTNDFANWSTDGMFAVGTVPTSLYDPTFATDFSIPPTFYQTTDKVKYRGVINLNKRPSVTLDTPDNQTLTENTTLRVSGQTVDEDAGNVITVWHQINNGPAQAAASSISDGSTPLLFDKMLTYKNKRIYLGSTDITGIDLAEKTDHILTVWAEDNKQGKSLEVARKFRVLHNRAPVIDGEDKDLGVFKQPPIVYYSATDLEGNNFTFSEYLDGKQIRSFQGVAGQQYTLEISHDAWLRLDLDVQHQIKIVATDNAGISSERIYTFTRTETHIEFLLNFDSPDVQGHFILDGMPKRVLITLERYIPEGASIESVKVCNNALDAVPTWEDCTGVVKGNRGYLFTNKTKTAANWAINLWVVLAKGTATEHVRLNGYGGAFD